MRGSGALLHSGLQTERHASGAGLKAQERRQDHIDHFLCGSSPHHTGLYPDYPRECLAEQFADQHRPPPILAEPAVAPPSPFGSA